MSKAILCTVKTTAQAERIFNDLKTSGFLDQDISVLLPDNGRSLSFEKNSKAPEGAVTGAGTGGLLGGALGWLVGIGSLAIPGLGPFIAAGPILAALSGVAVGAAMGGLLGTLIGMGIPEIEAKQYEGRLKQGEILISVHTEDALQQEKARAVFKRGEAENISSVEERKV